MIGTQAEAETAVQAHKAHCNAETLPKGWTRIGAGCSRTAYLSPSGVIYKVSRGYPMAQDVEFLTVMFFHVNPWMIPAGWRVPTTGRFRVGQGVVIAMEYVQGAGTYAYGIKGAEVFGVSDMHNENVFTEADGTLVPIDFGFSMALIGHIPDEMLQHF